LDALHAYGKEVMAGVPKERRVLITSHDAFRYFGRAYGLEVQAIQGISTESEAGLQRINELVDLIATRKIEAVFVESSVPQESIEALLEGARSRGQHVKIGGELYSDAMGSADSYEGTYIGMMDHNLTTIARALGSTSVPADGFRGTAATQSPSQ
jgi:manganese/zinc/iron transport system substrate-binding protein